MSRPVSTTDPQQRLWLAVVMQAAADLIFEPWKSLQQAEAMAFFLEDGPWGQRRNEIAEELGMHGDDVRRVGRERLTARIAADPPPPGIKLPPLVSPPRMVAPPRPVRPASPPREKLVLPHLLAVRATPSAPVATQSRGGHRSWAYNPFDPFRKLPSEERAEQAKLNGSAAA